MFITAVCVIFLIKLRWPKSKSLYDTFQRCSVPSCPLLQRQSRRLRGQQSSSGYLGEANFKIPDHLRYPEGFISFHHGSQLRKEFKSFLSSLPRPKMLWSASSRDVTRFLVWKDSKGGGGGGFKDQSPRSNLFFVWFQEGRSLSMSIYPGSRDTCKSYWKTTFALRRVGPRG